MVSQGWTYKGKNYMDLTKEERAEIRKRNSSLYEYVVLGNKSMASGARSYGISRTRVLQLIKDEAFRRGLITMDERDAWMGVGDLRCRAKEGMNT